METHDCPLDAPSQHLGVVTYHLHRIDAYVVNCDYRGMTSLKNVFSVTQVSLAIMAKSKNSLNTLLRFRFYVNLDELSIPYFKSCKINKIIHNFLSDPPEFYWFCHGVPRVKCLLTPWLRKVEDLICSERSLRYHRAAAKNCIREPLLCCHSGPVPRYHVPNSLFPPVKILHHSLSPRPHHRIVLEADNMMKHAL